jgi:hypothetical protein
MSTINNNTAPLESTTPVVPFDVYTDCLIEFNKKIGLKKFNSLNYVNLTNESMSYRTQKMRNRWINQSFTTKTSGIVTILEIYKSEDVWAQFANTGNIVKTSTNALRKGKCMDREAFEAGTVTSKHTSTSTHMFEKGAPERARVDALSYNELRAEQTIETARVLDVMRSRDTIFGNNYRKMVAKKEANAARIARVATGPSTACKSRRTVNEAKGKSHLAALFAGLK